MKRHGHNVPQSAGVGLVLLASCLMPAPVEEQEPLPNSPPRIDTSNITPDPTEGPKVMTTRCASYLFFAGVSDPDPDDTLYWRVFFDYHRQQAGTLLATEVRTAKPGVVINFTVDPSDRRFFATGAFTELHVVELFVSDRPFDDIPRKNYARHVQAPGLTASYAWPISLNDTDDCTARTRP